MLGGSPEKPEDRGLTQYGTATARHATLSATRRHSIASSPPTPRRSSAAPAALGCSAGRKLKGRQGEEIANRDQDMIRDTPTPLE